MKKSKVPGSGGRNSVQGTPQLNKHLMATQPNEERSHVTRDPGTQGRHGDQYPSMWDLARSLTKGK